MREDERQHKPDVSTWLRLGASARSPEDSPATRSVRPSVLYLQIPPKKRRRSPISIFVRAFLQQAEDILDVAASGDTSIEDRAIVLDRQGGMRMLDAAGWSLPALSAEFGATAVYKVQRRGGTIRVEGWDGFERCLLQRNMARSPMMLLPA
jgi:hypothetical protein